MKEVDTPLTKVPNGIKISSFSFWRSILHGLSIKKNESSGNDDGQKEMVRLKTYVSASNSF